MANFDVKWEILQHPTSGTSKNILTVATQNSFPIYVKYNGACELWENVKFNDLKSSLWMIEALILLGKSIGKITNNCEVFLDFSKLPFHLDCRNDAKSKLIKNFDSIENVTFEGLTQAMKDAKMDMKDLPKFKNILEFQINVIKFFGFCCKISFYTNNGAKGAIHHMDTSDYDNIRSPTTSTGTTSITSTRMTTANSNIPINNTKMQNENENLIHRIGHFITECFCVGSHLKNLEDHQIAYDNWVNQNQCNQIIKIE